MCRKEISQLADSNENRGIDRGDTQETGDALVSADTLAA